MARNLGILNYQGICIGNPWNPGKAGPGPTIFVELYKENRRMSTCNRLDLQTLGSQTIMPSNLPDHWSPLDGHQKQKSLKRYYSSQLHSARVVTPYIIRWPGWYYPTGFQRMHHQITCRLFGICLISYRTQKLKERSHLVGWTEPHTHMLGADSRTLNLCFFHDPSILVHTLDKSSSFLLPINHGRFSKSQRFQSLYHFIAQSTESSDRGGFWA